MISMMKRLFPGSMAKGHGECHFFESKRIIGDLNWLMMRFPLEIKDKNAWIKELNEAQNHFEVQESMLKKSTKAITPLAFEGELKEFQKEGLAFLLHNPRSLLADAMGTGKALPLDSFLLTPSGWLMMKYAKVGDLVIGGNGRPTKIIGIFPQGKRPVYKVTFSDGSFVECDEEHIWVVKTATHRFRNSHYRHLTLKEIIKKDIRYKNGNSLHFIPMVSPIEFEKRDLPLHPYVLGCFLGDGCLSGVSPSFSTSDKEIIDTIKRNLLTNLKIVRKNKYDYRICIKQRDGNTRNSLGEFFREFGLWGKKSDKKFIPDEYKFSSIDDRLQLLQGLLDTDGSVTKRDSHIEYSTISKRLGEDIQFIIQSLGGTAKIHSRYTKYVYKNQIKIGQKSYRISIALPNRIQPFKLRRKAENYHSREKYPPHRAIKKIEFIGEKECQCIKVDAEDGLFVIDNCIVTHNTPTALAWLVSLKSSPPYLIVVPPHIVLQWKSEIAKFLGESTSVHIIKGLKPYSLPASEIYLIHYLVLRGWKNYLPRFGFNACIFDEIQELRRSESDKYSAASLISDAVENVIGLSGTPVYNLGGEMFHVMTILNRNCLGDYGGFSREWCTAYGSMRIAEPEVFGEYLRSEGLMLRRRIEDVLSELPPKRRIVQNIDVDEGKFDELIAPTVELAKRIPSIKDAWERGRESMQAIDSTRMITGIAKAHYVTAFVKTLMEAGEKVLLYAHHHAVMDIYMEDLKEHLPVMISGRQDAKIKDEAQKAFMNEDTDIIIVSLRSGTGLNLQRARCVVFGELDWSPAIHSQCESRAHRIGAKDSVLCYYLTCNAGTDQHMMETLGLKTSQFINIMGDREETEEDRMMAQIDTQEHMKKVIELLQQGGRKKEISDEKIIEKLKKLERLPTSKEPTSIGEFYDEIDEEKEPNENIDKETEKKLDRIRNTSVSEITKKFKIDGLNIDDFE